MLKSELLSYYSGFLICTHPVMGNSVPPAVTAQFVLESSMSGAFFLMCLNIIISGRFVKHRFLPQ